MQVIGSPLDIIIASDTHRCFCSAATSYCVLMWFSCNIANNLVKWLTFCPSVDGFLYSYMFSENGRFFGGGVYQVLAALPVHFLCYQSLLLIGWQTLSVCCSRKSCPTIIMIINLVESQLKSFKIIAFFNQPIHRGGYWNFWRF